VEQEQVVIEVLAHRVETVGHLVSITAEAAEE
jgi:hypothetical protein